MTARPRFDIVPSPGAGPAGDFRLAVLVVGRFAVLVEVEAFFLTSSFTRPPVTSLTIVQTIAEPMPDQTTVTPTPLSCAMTCVDVIRIASQAPSAAVGVVDDASTAELNGATTMPVPMAPTMPPTPWMPKTSRLSS